MILIHDFLIFASLSIVFNSLVTVAYEALFRDDIMSEFKKVDWFLLDCQMFQIYLGELIKHSALCFFGFIGRHSIGIIEMSFRSTSWLMKGVIEWSLKISMCLR